MLKPNVVGRVGTASPTFLLVTIPPLQMSRSVATQVSHANRFSHVADLPTGENTTTKTDQTNASRPRSFVVFWHPGNAITSLNSLQYRPGSAEVLSEMQIKEGKTMKGNSSY